MFVRSRLCVRREPSAGRQQRFAADRAEEDARGPPGSFITLSLLSWLIDEYLADTGQLSSTGTGYRPAAEIR